MEASIILARCFVSRAACRETAGSQCRYEFRRGRARVAETFDFGFKGIQQLGPVLATRLSRSAKTAMGNSASSCVLYSEAS